MKKILLLLSVPLLIVSTAWADATSELNELLRGELSAVETYRQAMGKVENQTDIATLKEFENDHLNTADYLKKEISRLGGTPSTDSGAWGVWAKTVTGTAKLFGDASALKALKEGEEHGLKEHREAANDNDIPAEVRTEIKDKYIPKQEAHIAKLDQLIDKLS